jgi:hypothetical protein
MYEGPHGQVGKAYSPMFFFLLGVAFAICAVAVLA